MSNKTNLVLSGGGIKGIMHIGVLFALEGLEILNNITHFGGTSVGSLIIGLYVIGYKPSELYNLIKNFNFDELKNMDINNISRYGLNSGDAIEVSIRKWLIAKGLSESITLLELYTLTKKHISLTTVCINTMETCYLSYENWPNLELVKAIMMSLAIPLVFCPVIHENNIYIDGACLDNFPIRLFDVDNTIGILINDSKERIEIDNIETYLLRVFKCVSMGQGFEIYKVYQDNIIEINANHINSIDFGISNKLKDELFLIGFDSIVNNVEKLIKKS